MSRDLTLTRDLSIAPRPDPLIVTFDVEDEGPFACDDVVLALHTLRKDCAVVQAVVQDAQVGVENSLPLPHRPVTEEVS